MDATSVISLCVGIIGTAIAIYQTAVINESKKRHRELQFLLAGISNIALAKHQSWINQGNWLPEPVGDHEKQLYRIHARARDDFAEIANTVSALEGTIDSESSAITAMLEKGIKQVQLNNELQNEGLKNPTLPNNPKKKINE